ncbi:aldo/keto reductase [Mesorhizobium sp. LHD-90]|uniref:aldo/keto reductase n=1 Tax=Mesorhizobium sp. LHD-90 TaxID=3071414 RepID=UPI0027E061B0|nr:aldo/keto reductase [Mesorhizobium sp. LHD-90]MDQ6432654.1 aldo/keto reductase [Mesorhizobium sp. LHD-90]
MQKRKLGRTGLDIVPLVLGGNVFGWTADEKTSFEILDRFLAAGLNAIDTADAYSTWVPGNSGGESETIIGKWMKSRGNRDSVVLITKVGSDMGQGKKDLSAAYIEKAIEASLRRLQTDAIDLYFSHWPDPTVPYEETLGAYEKLLKKGKIRHIGASNLDAAQLSDALNVAREKGLPPYEVLQPEYNLYDRSSYDGPLRDLCMGEGLGVITYFSLAKGFLSGKYRSEADLGKSARGGGIKHYLDARGMRILAALDAVSARHSARQAEVALAWVIARQGVTAPIASATSVEQVDSLAKAASLALSPEDIAELDRASA